MLNKFLKVSPIIACAKWRLLCLIFLTSLSFHGSYGTDSENTHSKWCDTCPYLAGCAAMGLSITSLYFQHEASQYCYPGSPDWFENPDLPEQLLCIRQSSLEWANEMASKTAVSGSLFSFIGKYQGILEIAAAKCRFWHEEDATPWKKLVSAATNTWTLVSVACAFSEFLKSCMSVQDDTEWRDDQISTGLLSIVAADAIWTIGSPVFKKAGKTLWTCFSPKTKPCHSASETDWVRNPLQRTERAGNLPVT